MDSSASQSRVNHMVVLHHLSADDGVKYRDGSHQDKLKVLARGLGYQDSKGISRNFKKSTSSIFDFEGFSSDDSKLNNSRLAEKCARVLFTDIARDKRDKNLETDVSAVNCDNDFEGFEPSSSHHFEDDWCYPTHIKEEVMEVSDSLDEVSSFSDSELDLCNTTANHQTDQDTTSMGDSSVSEFYGLGNSLDTEDEEMPLISLCDTATECDKVLIISKVKNTTESQDETQITKCSHEMQGEKLSNPLLVETLDEPIPNNISQLKEIGKIINSSLCLPNETEIDKMPFVSSHQAVNGKIPCTPRKTKYKNKPKSNLEGLVNHEQLLCPHSETGEQIFDSPQKEVEYKQFQKITQNRTLYTRKSDITQNGTKDERESIVSSNEMSNKQIPIIKDNRKDEQVPDLPKNNTKDEQVPDLPKNNTKDEQMPDITNNSPIDDLLPNIAQNKTTEQILKTVQNKTTVIQMPKTTIQEMRTVPNKNFRTKEQVSNISKDKLAYQEISKISDDKRPSVEIPCNPKNETTHQPIPNIPKSKTMDEQILNVPNIKSTVGKTISVPENLSNNLITAINKNETTDNEMSHIRKKRTYRHLSKRSKNKTDKRLPTNLISVEMSLLSCDEDNSKSSKPITMNKQEPDGLLASCFAHTQLKNQDFELSEDIKSNLIDVTTLQQESRDTKMEICPDIYREEKPLFKMEETEARQPTCKNKKAIHQCPDCDFSTLRAQVLQRHTEAKHSGVKPYKCPLCEYAAHRKSTLERHYNAKHTNAKPHKCPHCKFISNNKYSLQSHIITRHSEKKPHQCELCDYSAATKGRLSRHVAYIHAKVKPLKCSLCDHACLFQKDLDSHFKHKHSTIRNFKCSECDYVAVRKIQVANHFASNHSNLKPHKCSLCDFASVTKGNLNYHYSHVHVKAKKYPCPQCDATFTHKFSLKCHIASKHTQERPFKCGECDYSTICRIYLQHHVANMHIKSKPYNCCLCDFSTIHKSKYKQHFAKAHPKEQLQL